MYFISISSELREIFDRQTHFLLNFLSTVMMKFQTKLQLVSCWLRRIFKFQPNLRIKSALHKLIHCHLALAEKVQNFRTMSDGTYSVRPGQKVKSRFLHLSTDITIFHEHILQSYEPGRWGNRHSIFQYIQIINFSI